MNVAHQRCFNHASREAVARCPECGRYFCRECIGDYEDRAICASCLKRLSARPLTHYRLGGLMRAAQVLAGIVLLWSSFYLLGKVLLAIPSAYHTVTLGQEKQQNNQ
jgi:hypothetical protein